MEIEGEQLIMEAQRGSDHAFYELMLLHKERLYRIAFSYLGNEQDALEAIQETTYRALLNLNKLKEPRYFQTWLIRILLNLCADERKRKQRLIYSLPESEEGRVSEEDDRVVLKEVLDALEPRQRQVIVLKYFEDMTMSEVAQAMDCPEGTAKTWLHKALQALRLRIGKEWNG